MSIHEQKKKIEDLLKDLDDETQSLKKSHTRLLISFEQMLSYIANIMEPDTPNNGSRKPVMQKDVEFLLQTYKEMSQIYYTQFELTLLQEIESRQRAASTSKEAIRMIDLKDPESQEGIEAMKRTRELLDEDCRRTDAALQGLRKDFPTLLQDALDKLRDEWQRLGTIAVASQALAKNRKLIQSLEAVVEVAAASIGVEAQRIVVVPGKEFTLNFFEYLEDFIVFTVPIYSVQAPWEWSIFWHELAAHRVRSLERGTEAIAEMRTNLRELHETFKQETDEARREHMLRGITRDNAAGISYLKDILSGTELLDPIDLGGFEHQFERMMLKLPRTNRFQLYEWMKDEGWCVDWFKELFEDAWSVLTIRGPFLIFLQDILSRKNTVDSRHPPLNLRLGVANELLKRSRPDGETGPAAAVAVPEPELSEKEKLVVKAAAEQLLIFLSLVMVPSPKPKTPASSDSLDLIRQENKLFENLPEEKVRQIFESVTNTVQEAILEWSEKLHTEADSVREAERYARDLISGFSKSGYFRLRGKKKSPVPSYDKLLKNKDQTDRKYEDLLALSFYDTDFGVSNVGNVYHFITKKFDTARLHSVPADVTGGAVSYASNGAQKKTSRELWNAAAVSGFQIA